MAIFANALKCTRLDTQTAKLRGGHGVFLYDFQSIPVVIFVPNRYSRQRSCLYGI